MNKANNGFAVAEEGIKAGGEIVMGGLLNLCIDALGDAREMTLATFFGDQISNLTVEDFFMACLWR